MIRKQCDRCDKWLETGGEMAGQKVTCPACGDINVMPRAQVAAVAALESGDAAAAPKPRDRAAAAGLPPDSGPEQRVMLVRVAMFRARPFTFLLLCLLVFGGGAGAVWFWFLAAPRVGWGAAVCAAVAAAALVVLIAWKISTYGTALEITNKRTTERRGILSRATSEVVHDNIRNVQITQTFFQRIMGVGSIGISSSGQDGIEIHVHGIPRPDKLRRVIDLYRPL